MLQLMVIRPVYLGVAPIWGPRPDSYHCQTVAGLLMWGALSDEWRGLYFTVAAVILRSKFRRTHDHILLSQIWDSVTWRATSPYLYPWGAGWPCYTPRYWVPFSSPSTTRRPTVEVFEPAYTRGFQLKIKVKVKVILWPTVSHPVDLGLKSHLGPKTRFLLLSDSCGFDDVRHPLWQKNGSVHRITGFFNLFHCPVFQRTENTMFWKLSLSSGEGGRRHLLSWAP
jgi:hypothetical protein